MYQSRAVCPTVSVSVPPVAVMGSCVDVLTVVNTKPRPPAGSVSVIIIAITEVPVVMHDPVVTYDPIRIGGGNDYTFIHTFQLPESDSRVQRVLVTSNVSNVPHGEQGCQLQNIFSASMVLVKGAF